jgi:CDP-2,3-bis-(O-geranylgeranyl)-sn-glycerol synthase
MRRLAMRGLRLIYFMAPAYVANMLPPFVAHWRGWNRPISERWLGSHKTVLGFGAGVLGSVVTTCIQSRIAWGGAIAVETGWLELGLLFGIGAMASDAVKSLFKRRAGIAPGRPWIPFDQIDFVVGALALVWASADLTPSDVPVILLVSAVGHVLVNHIGYALGVRRSPW